jgi:hypothetical protein
VWLTTLNVVNPERVVIAVNVARAERGQPFDVAYHARLSADAVPALLAAADRLPGQQGAALRADVREVWTIRAAERGDWRQWTLSYLRALTALARSEDASR